MSFSSKVRILRTNAYNKNIFSIFNWIKLLNICTKHVHTAHTYQTFHLRKDFCEWELKMLPAGTAYICYLLGCTSCWAQSLLYHLYHCITERTEQWIPGGLILIPLSLYPFSTFKFRIVFWQQSSNSDVAVRGRQTLSWHHW